MVNFDNSILADHIDSARYGENCELIPVNFLRVKSNRNDLDNKMLRLCILNCTMGGSTAPQHKIVSNSQYGSKRPKTFGTISNYNRYFLAADLENPPHCAAIMPRTIGETSNLLKYTQGDTLLGSTFCIHEPNVSFQSLGESTPILSIANEPLLPVASSSIALASTETLLACPTVAGETNYFVLTSKTISLRRVTLAKDASCSGIQCDRQKAKGECACLHATSSNILVYSFDVIFPVPNRIEVDGSTAVHNFRSLRTTELFFCDFEQHASTITPEDELNRTSLYRDKIKKMVTYINDNGGWTIVGWFMLGSTQDSANSQDKVQNSVITLHLSCLLPTADLSKDDDFNKLKIGHPGDSVSPVVVAAAAPGAAPVVAAPAAASVAAPATDPAAAPASGPAVAATPAAAPALGEAAAINPIPTAAVGAAGERREKMEEKKKEGNRKGRKS